MIGISKLYCGVVEPSDPLRYGRKSASLPSHLLQFSEDKKPVVVWNVTRKCNLNCIHCYSESENKCYDGEMNTDQAVRFIDDLAGFGVPVLLLSGGEPLLRPDLFDLITYTRKKGIRCVISTNATMISGDVAEKLGRAGLSYVGVSIDGIGKVHDHFRGCNGAFDFALKGIRNCMNAGIKVGLRFTITKNNADQIPGVFKLLETENIPRICFYHLVYTGRGLNLRNHDLSHSETRSVVDSLIDKSITLHENGKSVEVLTVDNHADGVYLYMRMLREKSPRATQVLELLRMNGGNSSGLGIACVSWDGTVYPDQFWRHNALGNVCHTPFSEIWKNSRNPLLESLRKRKSLLKGKCGRCLWKDICNGNFRVRAEAAYNDLWEEDPACYLTEKEITGNIG
jgi:12,18-didecarboxysiroheme deacetylase